MICQTSLNIASIYNLLIHLHILKKCRIEKLTKIKRQLKKIKYFKLLNFLRRNNLDKSINIGSSVFLNKIFCSENNILGIKSVVCIIFLHLCEFKHFKIVF
jgi:hypothetical protein